jgi:dipeptidase E
MVVAIGGGEIRTGQTRLIDEAIVRLAGKSRPRVLFLPTASGDAAGYVDSFQEVYHRGLGCDVDALYLHTRPYDDAYLDAVFFRSDIVYVGGGDTAAMLELWRKTGIDRRLQAAHRQGTLLAGLSAGSICWFESGISDSAPSHSETPFSLVPGLGLIPGVHSPHHGDRWPDPRFQAFLRSWSGTCFSLDDGCALVADGDRFTYLRSVAGASGWLLRCAGGQSSAVEILDPRQVFGSGFIGNNRNTG